MSVITRRLKRYLARRTSGLRRKMGILGHRPPGPLKLPEDTPYFDKNWYLQANPDVRIAGVPALEHYLNLGWREGRSPHPLINPSWIYGTYPETRGQEPISWFLRCGRAAGASITPSLNRQHYRKSNPDLVGINDETAHYLGSGWKENRSSHPNFDAREYEAGHPELTFENTSRAIIDFVQKSVPRTENKNTLFCPIWYADQVLVRNKNYNELLDHYKNIGWKKGYSPNPLFDPHWYSDQLSEHERHQNPIDHYRSVGAKAGLSPHPLFDHHWYISGVEDISNFSTPLEHFLSVGDRRGHSPHCLFDPIFYRNRYPEYAQFNVGPAEHYLRWGIQNLNWPNPLFDSEHFSSIYPECKNGILDYVKAPKRHTHPLFDGDAFALSCATGSSPLQEYLQYRSNLSHSEYTYQETGSPSPRKNAYTNQMRSDKSDGTLISILMPMYNSPEVHLRRAIDSVRAQTHSNWELILIDDGSAKSEGKRLAFKYSQIDERILLSFNSENKGISSATNDGLNRARGEYIALIDHDDVLENDALSSVISKMNEQDADVAYTDQSYISESGKFISSFHKPDYSPILLAGVMYVGHLLVVRRALALSVGGFDSQFDRLQDYEFMLRISEHTSKIIHIPDTLYHWRMIPGSIASDANAKGRLEPLQARAVTAHLVRKGLPIVAEPHPTLAHRLRLQPAFNSKTPRPSVHFVLRGDRPDELINLARSACKAAVKTAPITIIDFTHGACATSSLDRLNQIIQSTKKDAVVFIDPICDLASTDWLDHVLMHLVDPTVVAAAPHIVTTKNRVVSAGTVLSKNGLVAAHEGEHIENDGSAGSLACDREVLGLNGHIFALKVDAVRAIGGLDTTTFATPFFAFSDLTLRGHLNAYRSIAVASTPVEIVISNFEANIELDAHLFRSKYNKYLGKDPYYNANYNSDRHFH